MRRILVFFLLTLGAAAQVSVVLAPAPQFASVQSNGSPNGLGCVFTYISGTTTPLATFTDSTGTTQNPNPVVLSSAGTANIWIQSGLAYTFLVKSFGGVNCISGQTIYSVRGIAGGNSSLITTVTFTSTPLFTVTSQNQVFEITLTGNAAAQPLIFSGVPAPAFVTFQITEDAVGGRTFTYPANALGAAPINTAANAVTTQMFIWNGITTTAVGPGSFGTSSPPGVFSVSTLNASTSVISPIFADVTNPAASGTLRLASTDTINWRNNANNADNLLISKNTSDQLVLGSNAGEITIGPIISSSPNPASTGSIRNSLSDNICWRNAGNTGDICLSKNANDVMQISSGTQNPGLVVGGGYACNLTVQTTNYSVARTDCVVQGNASGGSFTITLPSANTGQLFIITRSDTSANTLTLAPFSGTINNLATINLSVGGTVLCIPNGTNINCTQSVGDTRDFSVTGCTPASSTDSQCTGTITISPAMANTSYIPMLTVNGNGGSVPNLTINVNGSLTTGGIPYNISCTFSCGSVNTPTIYVHIAQK